MLKLLLCFNHSLCWSNAGEIRRSLSLQLLAGVNDSTSDIKNKHMAILPFEEVTQEYQIVVTSIG